MSNVQRSLAFSALSKYINMGINLASVVIFSRLLTPDELGVHVVAVAIAALAIEVRLLGTGGYLIRKESISKLDCQRVVGVTMAISFPLGILMFLTSGWVGSLFDEPGVDNVLAVLSLGFITAPFISVSRSVLSRDFRFDVLLLNNVLATVITFLASLAALFLNAGYMSLSIGLVVGQFSKMLFFIFYKSPDISWKPVFKNTLEVFKFGVFVSQAALLRKLAETSPDIIIGKLGNPALAAIFSRSIGLYKFFFDSVSSAVQPVVMPYLSNVKRVKGNTAEAYLNAVTHLSILIIPVLSVLALSAKPAILLMFGDQWLDSVQYVPALCILGMIRCIYCWADTMLVTAGFEKTNFYRQIVITICTILLCIVGFNFGLIYVAWGLVITTVVDSVLLGIALKRYCKVSPSSVMKSHLPSVSVGIICAALTLALDYLFEFNNISPFYVLVLLGLFMPIIWMLSVLALKHPISDIIWSLLSKFIGIKKSTQN